MRIVRAQMTQSFYTPAQYKGSGLPEIAIVGRSNAGKSSLINALCGNKKLARVSGAPGKTRSINGFLINDAFLLMDLPGYGFARRSAAEQNSWRNLVDGYFQKTQSLLHLLLLCDIRHDVSAGDVQMAQWLQYYEIPFTLVATKADKIAKSKRPMQVQKLKRQLAAQDALAFSALEGVGKDALLTALDRILTQSLQPQTQENGE